MQSSLKLCSAETVNDMQHKQETITYLYVALIDYKVGYSSTTSGH